MAKFYKPRKSIATAFYVLYVVALLLVFSLLGRRLKAKMLLEELHASYNFG